ncbi:MAG: PIG-L family deacetylase [Alphaproteobacteria bacterium]|nr:PIG-L family deacetylase [Alphaproteobacteria bacterium]
MYARHILLLAPHPDDEVVGAGAAIGRARAAGHRVFVAFLTTGVPDRSLLWPWQRGGHAARVARRRAEAEEAAALLGFEIAFHQDFPTRTLKAHLGETRQRVLAAIDCHAIEMIWVPAYEGGHQDHDSASFLASTLGGRVPVWEFAEYNNIGGKVRSQEFPCPSGQEIAIALDVREIARKRAALALYPSERGNLAHIQAGRECFRPLAGYDYGRAPHPGVLFYQRFQWVWPRHPRVDYTKPEEVCAALAGFQMTKDR